MRAPIPFVASVLLSVLPAPLMAHGGHEAAGTGALHALVHLLPALVPAALALGAGWLFLRRRSRARSG